MATNIFFSQQNAETGLWYDFKADTLKWLLEERKASILTTAVGVALAISGPYIFKIALFSTFHAARFIARKLASRHTENPEQQTLLPRRHQLSTVDFLERTKNAGGIREFFSILWEARRQTDGSQFTYLLLVYLILIGLGIARIMGGVIAANLMADGTALWSSSRCGVWRFDSDNSGDSAASRHDVFDRQKEARAGEYARSCYNPPHALESMSCNFFFQPNISFSVSSWTYECPFQDSALCMVGTQAVTFDTGLIDASVLGINAKEDDTYKFRRSSTCAPVSIDYPYVQSKEMNGTMVYEYYYGAIDDDADSSAATFSSIGNPFNMPLPVYNVEAYTWDPENAPENYWLPLEGFRMKTQGNHSLTIMFISSLRILYVEPSTDPIFSTDASYDIDGSFWYYKSDPRYRVLACSDSYEFCSHDGRNCWTRTSRPTKLPPAYWLMDLSSNASSTYDSIAKRLGSAMIAQEKVSQFTSAALPKDHWVEEAKNLFATSLARFQFDAWSIASGEDAIHEGADGYIETTPKEAGELCGFFKFRSASHRNIHFLAFLLTILLVPIPSFILSHPKKMSSKCSTMNQKSQQKPDSANGSNNQGSTLITDGVHASASLTEPRETTGTESGVEVDEEVSDGSGNIISDPEATSGTDSNRRITVEAAAVDPERQQMNNVQKSNGTIRSDEGDDIVLFWLVFDCIPELFLETAPQALSDLKQYCQELWKWMWSWRAAN